MSVPVSGFNIGIQSDQLAVGVFGGSIEISPDQFTPNNSGFSFDNQVDLVLYAVDINGDLIPNATFTVAGSIMSDTVITGNFIALSVGQNDTLSVDVIANGFQLNTEVVNFIEDEEQRIPVTLFEVEKIEFTCDTNFKNSNGDTVSRPLTNGYVEVKFSTSNPANIDDYSVCFEAMPVGGSKYNSVVLGYELIASDASGFTYKVDVVQQNGDYCYLSNIMKIQC